MSTLDEHVAAGGTSLHAGYCPLDRWSVLLSAFLSVSGVGFWFFLVFPFGQHNESYGWIPSLELQSGWVWLTEHVVASTFRPLGQVTAWLSYRLSGGSIVPIQLFNVAVTVAAWLVTWGGVREKRLFALVAWVVGGVFFSGYIYLFHIHGVFYGPTLLFVAALVRFSDRRVSMVAWSGLVLGFVVALAYHPFSLPLFVAFVAALLTRVVHWAWLTGGAVAGLLVVAGAEHLFSVAVLPWTSETLPYLLTSYRMAEVHPLVSGTAVVLALLVSATIRLGTRARVTLGVAVLVGATACSFLDLPQSVVLVAICIAKAGIHGRWQLVFVLAGAAVLPFLTVVGTPTYTVFVYLACAYTAAIDASRLESWIAPWWRVGSSLAVAAMLAAFALLRMGVEIPLASRFSLPILAERERSLQLEQVVEWSQSSPYRRYELFLQQKHSGNPLRAQEGAIDRRYRPPTDRYYLRMYMAWRQSSLGGFLPGRRLLVLFGGAELPGREPVRRFPGRYAGDAVV